MLWVWVSMIEFRPLGYFLTACEHSNLGLAADELGIAPSTLSASLKGLERELGVSLLRKRGAGVSPLPAARWLFRAGLPLLLLEAYARRSLRAADGAAGTLLRVEIGLKFSFGRVSKAINQAIAQTAEEEPLVLVHPQWTSEYAPDFTDEAARDLGVSTFRRLAIDAVARPADSATGEIEVLSDPWLLVRRCLSADQAESAFQPPFNKTIYVPALPRELMDQLQAHGRRHDLGDLRLLDDHPSALPQLLEDHFGAAFLLPSTAVAARLGMRGVNTQLLDPPLAATIIGQAEPDDDVGRRFLDRVRIALEAPEGTTMFAPNLTSRFVRYFNLAHEQGRVSGAARAANVAQAALSQQLLKLEETVGGKLFDRRAYGLSPTAMGARFAPIASLLERRLREMSVAGLSIALGERGQLSLGILPSVSHQGLLVNRVAEAITRLRRRRPATSFAIQEAPNATLQSWVMHGQVGLAIVETALPQLPRIPLDATEDLAVISDPRHVLFAPGSVTFTELARAPIILPTAVSGLRQLVDSASRAHGIEIRPRDEVNSLAMLITLLGLEPVCTVLPPSAVRRELEAGDLVAHPITEPVLQRRLYVIYSGERSLTEAEREFVSLLREGLAQQAPRLLVAAE
jgi:DNA-binding transcriptional LysR family regulator